MCVNCNNQGCQECGEAINTSQMSFDGSFTNIPIPPNSTMNQVLLLMESYFNDLQVQDVTYTVAEANCFLAVGNYSFTEIISAITTAICETNTSIGEDVTTTDVTLDGITVPKCLLPFTGTTSTALFNHIMSFVCGLANRARPIVNVLDDDSYGVVVDPDNPNTFATDFLLQKTHEGIVENETYVFNHTTPTYSASNLNITVQPIESFLENALIIREDSATISLDSSKDNYIYLLWNGGLEKQSVAYGEAQPPASDKALILYKMVTDATGVTSYVELFDNTPFNTTIADGAVTTSKLANDSVTTSKIHDGEVTSAKLANVVTASTEGHVSLLTVTVNAKGQVTSVNSNIDLSGIADGDILVYDAGIGGFVKGSRRNVTPSGVIPSSNGTDYVASSITENADAVGLNKPLKIRKYTAVEASALGLDDSILIYVTSTDATFTSVGFWGVVASAWVKL